MCERGRGCEGGREDKRAPILTDMLTRLIASPTFGSCSSEAKSSASKHEGSSGTLKWS